MSDTAWSIIKATQRLSRHDPTLKWIHLYRNHHTDAEVAELADSLLAHPDIVTHVYLSHNCLTDETGVKLARYVAASSTVQELSLSYNQLGEPTYLALAAALRVNTSLQYLYLFGNQAKDKSRIDAAFIDTLRVNPSRPASSKWCLYSFRFHDVDLERLRVEAEQLGHPSLQMILNNQLQLTSIRSIRR